MATRWGGASSSAAEASSPTSPTTLSNGAGTSPTTTTMTNNTTSLPGFDRFMIERFSSVCWTALANPAFNPRDATSRQVAAEMASLQKTIFTKTGLEFVTHLRDVSFPEMGLEKSQAEEYLRALQSRDLKGFRQFFLVSSFRRPSLLSVALHRTYLGWI